MSRRCGSEYPEYPVSADLSDVPLFEHEAES